MRIGLRTIKTALSATLAILLANALKLGYPTSAGIIAVLSLTNTKRSSLLIGGSRLLALTLATFTGACCFLLLGYNTIAFGVFLLLFIPLSVRFQLSEGIVVCSVLVTHYLAEKSFALSLIANEYLLMIIGVGFALLMNLYMPDTEKEIRQSQEEIEEAFSRILSKMSKAINQSDGENLLTAEIEQLQRRLRQAEELAIRFSENHWFSKKLYYSDYFAMRRIQAQVLLEMNQIMEQIQVEPRYISRVQDILSFTAETFSEENDGRETLRRIAEVNAVYQVMPLPQTRYEFENRAKLFQFFQTFKSFIEIKAEFAQEN